MMDSYSSSGNRKYKLKSIRNFKTTNKAPWLYIIIVSIMMRATMVIFSRTRANQERTHLMECICITYDQRNKKNNGRLWSTGQENVETTMYILSRRTSLVSDQECIYITYDHFSLTTRKHHQEIGMFLVQKFKKHEAQLYEKKWLQRKIKIEHSVHNHGFPSNHGFRLNSFIQHEFKHNFRHLSPWICLASCKISTLQRLES